MKGIHICKFKTLEFQFFFSLILNYAFCNNTVIHSENFYRADKPYIVFILIAHGVNMHTTRGSLPLIYTNVFSWKILTNKNIKHLKVLILILNILH